MGEVGSITSATQAVYTGIAARKVQSAYHGASTRDADGDGDRSPPGTKEMNAPAKGGQIDTYA